MINRTQQPPVIIPEHIAIQEANISEISGGIPVYVIEAGTQSVVKIELVFAAGKIPFTAWRAMRPAFLLPPWLRAGCGRRWEWS